MTESATSVSTLIEHAAIELDASRSRGGWVGPARFAYDDVIEAFRARLLALAIRAYSLE